ncbi:MAG: hypothetical protein WBD55_12235, partial [Dehalococcoidia bacterium]
PQRDATIAEQRPGQPGLGPPRKSTDATGQRLRIAVQHLHESPASQADEKDCRSSEPDEPGPMRVH